MNIRKSTKRIMVATLIFCVVFSILLAGFLSHELAPNEQHVHGFQYSHSLLDLHNMQGSVHQHDSNENGSSVYEISVVLASTSTSFLVLLGLLIVVFFFAYREKLLEKEYGQQFRNYRAQFQLSSITSYFTQIFARGILHPKTF